MKHSITPRLLFLTVVVLLTSCSKDSIEKVYELDKNVFFTIRIDGKEYTSYGYLNKTSPMNDHGGPSLNQVSIKDSAGNNIKEITVRVDQFHDGAPNIIGSGLTLDLGNCEMRMKMRKPGDNLVGEYHSLIGDEWDNWLNKSAMPADEYLIDTSGLSFTITKESKHPTNYFKTITGSFSCKVFHYTNPGKLIQATGTFIMYSN